jgi:hypothetical protein
MNAHSGLQKLIDKLKERPISDENKQKKEWLFAIDQLFAKIKEWLEPAVSAGVLRIGHWNTEIVEGGLGNYSAPILLIIDGEIEVRLVPIGSRVAGVVPWDNDRKAGLRGLVNLVCGPTQIPIILNPQGNWMALPMRGKPCDLTEDIFMEIIYEILIED